MVSNYTANAASFAPDKPRAWSDTPIREPGGVGLWNLDLAPDGKRFAVFSLPEAAGEQKGAVHVTFLLNFFDELRRRVPRFEVNFKITSLCPGTCFPMITGRKVSVSYKMARLFRIAPGTRTNRNLGASGVTLT